MPVLSDEPGWWERAQRRRAFCAPNAPWLMASEVGWPVSYAHTLKSGDEDFLQGARECSAYVRATRLTPKDVYGIGVRALWLDGPGRFAVVHVAVPESVELARCYRPTTAAPPDPVVRHSMVTGLPSQVIRREKGQPQPTVGEAIALAIAFGRVAPEQCLGAYQRSVPTLVSDNDATTMGLGEGGFAITAPGDQMWPQQFVQGKPYRLEPGAVVQSHYGAIELIRLSWRAMAERARDGDASVPASPLELGVAFLETVGVAPWDCWGVFEAGAGPNAYVQIVYRKAGDDTRGRWRSVRYLESIGVALADLDVGHPEGHIVLSRGRFRITQQ